MHVIVGKGNLGIDLKLALTAAGHKAVILTRSGGFKWTEDYTKIQQLSPTHIWITAGHGSVTECSTDFAGALATHVAMPIDIARTVPRVVRVAAFSSDYVAHPYVPSSPDKATPNPRSLYEFTKLWMETGLEALSRPLTTVFRVGSLYGQHYPERTFPGKMRANFPKPCELSLPDNIVVPTPTWWIARMLVANLEEAFDLKRFRIHHIAPVGGCSTREWGKLILGPEYTIQSRGLDPMRPAHSCLGCSLPVGHETSWRRLWEEHITKH